MSLNGNEPVPGPTNLGFIESLYEDYVSNPQSVPADWQNFFAKADGDVSFPRAMRRPAFKNRSIFNPSVAGATGVETPFSPATTASHGDRVYLLIRLYRVRGHCIAPLLSKLAPMNDRKTQVSWEFEG
jgi:2-oxoglutarate dehydrogenase complex dehydrogenase (E1) component-like enzyme